MQPARGVFKTSRNRRAVGAVEGRRADRRIEPVAARAYAHPRASTRVASVETSIVHAVLPHVPSVIRSAQKPTQLVEGRLLDLAEAEHAEPAIPSHIDV